MPGLHVGAGDPSSSPHVRMASISELSWRLGLQIRLTVLFSIPEVKNYTSVLLFDVMFVRVRYLCSCRCLPSILLHLMMEGEDWPLPIVLWPSPVCCGACIQTCRHMLSKTFTFSKINILFESFFVSFAFSSFSYFMNNAGIPQWKHEIYFPL